nr:hypothetical protein BaRGS_015235 [Batillaria attramentaria]
MTYLFSTDDVSRLRLKVDGGVADPLSKGKQLPKKPRSHICDQCGKTLVSSSSLMKHKRTVHSKEPEVMCPEPGCGRIFQRLELLEDHRRNKHSTERPFPCEVCGKTFALSHYRNQHASHCGRKRYKCSVCAKAFSSRSVFRDHKRSHEGHSIVCPCGKVLKWSSALSKHRKTCPMFGVRTEAAK